MEAIKLIPAIVMSLVIAGLVTTAGVKVLANFRSSTVSSLSTTAVTDEEQTASGVIVTPTLLASGVIITGVQSVSINHTGTDEKPVLTPGTDYNASVGYHGTGLITLAGNYSGNNTHINYSYSTKDAVLNATVDTIKGTAEISGQFGTIGIIAAMVIILMMIGGLTAYFGLR